MKPTERKPPLTRAEAKARTERLRAAGITVESKAPSTVTLMGKRRGPTLGDNGPGAAA